MRIFLSSATRAASFQLYSSRRGISFTGVQFNHSSDKKRQTIDGNSGELDFLPELYTVERDRTIFERDTDEDFFEELKEFQFLKIVR